MKKTKRKIDLPDYPISKDKFDPLAMIMTDPLGSYTGIPVDSTELPVQDADDL